MHRARSGAIVAVVIAVMLATGCARRALTPQPEPPSVAGAVPIEAPTPGPVQQARVVEPLPTPPQPLVEELVDNKALDDLNRTAPLDPVLFGLDSVEIDQAGQVVARSNADRLRQNSTWVVTVEGHCDERGTAEYNLALGERRAAAVKAYLVSLGVSADRIRTVSYGKEFPFDPGHTEEAWAKNRRAHFVVVSR